MLLWAAGGFQSACAGDLAQENRRQQLHGRLLQARYNVGRQSGGGRAGSLREEQRWQSGKYRLQRATWRPDALGSQHSRIAVLLQEASASVGDITGIMLDREDAIVRFGCHKVHMALVCGDEFFDCIRQEERYITREILVDFGLSQKNPTPRFRRLHLTHPKTGHCRWGRQTLRPAG